MSGNIVIHTLRCGTMRVLPRERYIADRGLLRERVELPVNAYLIEHPKHGRILLDTGWSSDCRELLPPRLLKFYEPKIGKGETAAEQLEEMGLRAQVMASIMGEIEAHMVHRIRGQMDFGVIVYSERFGRVGETAGAERLLEGFLI